MKAEKKGEITRLVSKLLETGTNSREREEIIHLLLTEQAAQSSTNYTYAQRVADRMAKVAGSWHFIISFALTMVFWIGVNLFFLVKPFDPYPFILLNLALSCLAAIQAPIIMMSQNRQEEKDRERAENDYKVNLKAEIILEDLHYKIDHLIAEQKHLKEKMERWGKEN